MPIRLFTRWLGALAAPLLVVALSAVLAWSYFSGTQAGTPGLFVLALKFPILSRFAKGWLLQEVLPLYGILSLVGWTLTAALGAAFLGKDWRNTWNGRHAFLATCGGLVLIHAWLWFKVPTTMWVIPGLRRLPMGLALALVPLLGIGLLRWALPRGGRAWGVAAASALGWVLLAQAPFWLQTAPGLVPHPGEKSPEIVLLAIDGLRPDVAYKQGLASFQGQHAAQAISPIPATRMLYSLLWGGDPIRFTSAHIMPDVEEYEHKARYHTLQAAREQGKKVRFFIDDGGTIGLSQRGEDFDEVGMPARGWENFISSNLSVHLPIYASWLDVLRVFPTTNPWVAPDRGLRSALERGRGADWVFFHSCLIHQPVFLTRHELGQIPGWAKVPAARMEPIPSVFAVTESMAASWDDRGNPALAYQIRVRTLMESWAPVWNALAQDPQYRTATRILFSDHGERFQHATETLQVQGVHGYDLNPWELQVPLILQDAQGRSGSFSEPVSLLGLRAGLHDLAAKGQRPTLEAMAAAPVIARLNLQRTIGDTQGDEFVTFDPLGVVESSHIGPDGMWAMTYSKPAKERGEQAAVACWEKDGFAVYRPLKAGGALRSLYSGYAWIKDEKVDETAFRSKKLDIENRFSALSYGD
jgi:hypothetical protein